MKADNPPTSDLIERLRKAARDQAGIAAFWPPGSDQAKVATQLDDMLSEAADRLALPSPREGRLAELLTIALDEYESHNGRIKGLSQHWSVDAIDAIEAGSYRDDR